MITVECPHCSNEHISIPEENKKFIIGGKVVVDCTKCDKLYTVEDDGECIFTH